MKTIRSVFATVATGVWLGLAFACWGAPGPDLDVVRQLNQSFIDVASKVSPSVVVINVIQKQSTAAFDDTEDPDLSDFWKKFHEQFKHAPRERTTGQGSGIILRPDGYILTNGHVIEDAESISVRLRNGKTYRATLHGVDPQSDLAVIKIDAQGLAPAELADSSKTRVGEFAIAIGAPFGFDFSVTFGHVSAKSRSNIIEGLEGMSMDQDFIQTDALINPGNSGGPLVNIDGQVIGVNTLIEGLHSGIGFAIPSNLAREVSDQLIQTGKFNRPYLGIAMRAVQEESDLRELIPGVQAGVVVRQIVPDGPAAKSELKPTDIITAVDGQPVATPQQLRGAIRGKKIGAPITLEVFRQGKTLPIQISPASWPEAPAAVASTKPGPDSKETPRVELGLSIKSLTPALAAQLGTSTAAGVLVASVEQNSPAARGGVKPGDIITAIDQQPVTTRKEYQAAIDKADLKKGVMVTLLSAHTARFEILKALP